VKKLLVATDLDGSLLDHESYSFSAAADALARIRSLQLPLILASSKTRPEILQLQTQLGIRFPFICENGAAIISPGPRGYLVEALAPPRDKVLQALAELRSAHGYLFTGFADVGVEEIATMTGLGPAEAAQAADRDFTEPLLWLDTDERLARFREQLAANKLVATQGGRFLSIAGQCDKGAALRRLRQLYGGVRNTLVIALGDSPNDESMLDAADIAVVIKSARSEAVNPVKPERVIRTTEPGPSGWQTAVSTLLDDYATAYAPPHGDN
jgi:mannosyl-3-phosphoglycerate phosphatase